MDEPRPSGTGRGPDGCAGCGSGRPEFLVGAALQRTGSAVTSRRSCEQIVTFVLLLLASIAVFSISLYVRRRLQFAWRVWLTKNTLSVWMAEGRHYQLGLIAGDT